ncbi:MAG: T9SS type A sorting domain-containing protein [Flavobacteriales bacterium]|nr:MAG: T9SS type A sorting domain-containing protein [Flavobacteriales bacterium]
MKSRDKMIRRTRWWAPAAMLLGGLFQANAAQAQFCNATVTNGGVVTPTGTVQTVVGASGTRTYWTFNTTAGTSYTFQNCGSGGDTYLRLYSTATGGTVLASNDDGCGTQSTVTYVETASSTRSILLTNFSCNTLSANTTLSYSSAAPWDPCATIPTISACGVSTVSSHTGAGSWSPGTCGFSTPGQEKLYTFTPSVTGAHALQVTAATGGYVDYFWKLASDGCTSTGWTCIDDLNAAATVNLPSWTAGVPVYIMLDPENTGAMTHTFQINCPAACTAPTSSAATSITTGSALANWTCAGCTGTGPFIVEYGPAATFTTPGSGATAGPNGTVIPGATAPQLISGLASSTQYRYFVRQDCDGGNTTFSPNSAGQTFTTLAAPPPNDACSNAITIACASTPVTGSTILATVDAEYSDCGAGNEGPQGGVWYRIVGDDNQYTITTCDASGTGYDTRLTVYSGSCGAFTCVTANDDMTPACTTGSFRSRVQFNANSGTDYYVFVHGYGTPGATGNFILNITCAPLCLPVPGNDVCASATALTVDAAPTAGTNTCAAATVGNPTCESAFATLPDVFYSFTASAAGTNLITFNLYTASNLGYALYDACGGTQIACNPGVTSGTTYTHTGLTSGNTYWVRVWTDDITTGTFDVQVNQPCQPAATRTAVPSCGTNEFFIDVNVTDLGTSSDLDITTDFVGDAEPTSVGLGVTQIGPYPSGTTVVVTLVHDNGGICNLTLTGLSYNCPPANDACANAINVSSYPYASPVVNNSLATDDVPASVCTGPYKNVWWRVEGVCGTMTASTCAGSNFDTEIAVFSGDCLTPLEVICNDDFCGVQSQVTWNSTPGAFYYISVGSYSSFSSTGNIALTVTATVDDTDGDLIADCDDNCPTTPGEQGDACDDSNPNTVLDVLNGSCVCAGQACTTDLDLIWQPDGVSSITWELRQQGTDILVQAGGGIYPETPAYSEATCLPDGCFYLVVTDDAGDGIAGGGYQLKINSGARIIDNLTDAFGSGGFTSGYTSQVANGEGFCLPLGQDRLIFTSCDKTDWKTSPCGGEFVVANTNAAVSTEYGVSNATSGYQMWWFDPNGGYSFKRFQSHNTSNGLPASATRACHFQLNSWSGNQLQEGVVYNVKVRGRVAGNYLPWGPACRLTVNNAAAQCPRTKLMDIPGNQYLSCGQTRPVGTSQASLVHAKPVRRMNNNCNWVSANRYQFRFRLPAENFELVKTSALGKYFVNTNGLQCDKTYEVDVRASFDGGATWCHSSDPWGDVCLLTTTCSNALAEEGTSTGTAAGTLRMYPNPNQGDQLMLSLSAVAEGVQTVSIDLFDVFGKRVAARTIPVQDGFVNTMLELNGELANGLYMVSITAGADSYTERLVIQK